jgi:hypothetical protein
LIWEITFVLKILFNISNCKYTSFAYTNHGLKKFILVYLIRNILFTVASEDGKAVLQIQQKFGGHIKSISGGEAVKYRFNSK